MTNEVLEGVIGAEYPYYRDDPVNWKARLQALKEAGIDTVSLYIPWVHHQPRKGILDFDGISKPTRDVVGYLELVRELGMKAIVKPGPFIHAETRNGGLPDHMVADLNLDLEARLDSKGSSINWKWGRDEHGEVYRPVMATPFGEEANARIRNWFTDVKTKVIDPFKDVIVAVQPFNEWFNSDCEHVIEHSDYSESAQSLFRTYLKNKYGRVVEVNAPVDFNVESLDDLKLRLDWADFSTREYMQELHRTLNVFEDIPIIMNPKTAVPDKRDFSEKSIPTYSLEKVPEERSNKKWDTWLAKVSQIPKFGAIYTPTNWAGVLPDDPEARLAYEIAIKFNGSKAICNEDNWGFARLYDPRFESSRVVLWQTLFGFANGMQGSIVYSGIQTHNVDPELDNEFMTKENPYPASAPITAKGEKTEKYEAMCDLTNLLKENEITQARPEVQVAWANYAPYAQMAMWNSDDRTYEETFWCQGYNAIRAGYKGLDNFATQLNKEGIEYGIVNLETEVLDPEETPILTMISGFYMDEDTQQKLVDYANSGGTLILYGDLPTLDEKFQPCDILEKAAHKDVDFRILPEEESPFETPDSESFLETLASLGVQSRIKSDNPAFYVRELAHKDGTRYSFIMSTSTEEQKGKVTIGDDVIEDITLAPRTAEVYSIKGGNINKLFTTANFS